MNQLQCFTSLCWFRYPTLFSLMFFVLIFFSCGSDDNQEEVEPPANLRVSSIELGSQSIHSEQEVFTDNEITITFNKAINFTASAFELKLGSTVVSVDGRQGSSNAIALLETENNLAPGEYTLTISNSLKATDGAGFSGASYQFTVLAQPLTVDVSINSSNLSTSEKNTEIPLSPVFKLTFSDAIDESTLGNSIVFSPDSEFTISKIDDKTYELKVNELDYWKSYGLTISSSLATDNDQPFNEVSYSLFTTLDDSNKFPEISNEVLLTQIQEETFKYFWEFGHPSSGMARERNTSGDLVTTGGSGFGLMAMVVAVERGFITRNEAITRWQKIVKFLESADRFHGAWPHWMNGNTGKVIPFSDNDNGADLVETAFLIQGLLTVREYLNPINASEKLLIDQITKLWEEVEWTWFQKNDEKVLYWHWSPEHEWQINLKIQGHNETQLVYILAAASPTYPISKDVYVQGYTKNGTFTNGASYYNTTLPLGPELGGPLFFSHYSYLGLDPRRLQDSYASYWEQNRNHSVINHSYCVENPKDFVGYSKECWGLTASDNHQGYSAHSPTNDLGVITPTAAISSLPYTPELSMEAIRFFYYKIGDRIWGEYGFFDAFNASEEWYADSYLAIDQGPIICMIENYRTELLWNLFMENPEIKSGLNNLDFTY